MGYAMCSDIDAINCCARVCYSMSCEGLLYVINVKLINVKVEIHVLAYGNCKYHFGFLLSKH